MMLTRPVPCPEFGSMIVAATGEDVSKWVPVKGENHAFVRSFHTPHFSVRSVGVHYLSEGFFIQE